MPQEVLFSNRTQQSSAHHVPWPFQLRHQRAQVSDRGVGVSLVKGVVTLFKLSAWLGRGEWSFNQYAKPLQGTIQATAKTHILLIKWITRLKPELTGLITVSLNNAAMQI